MLNDENEGQFLSYFEANEFRNGNAETRRFWYIYIYLLFILIVFGF